MRGDRDGHGGADPAGGIGIRGVDRRLATVDGALTVDSPTGGPAVVTMEAAGRSNTAIATRLRVSESAVTKHTASIFTKLEIPVSQDDNRRVLAVLAYLNT